MVGAHAQPIVFGIQASSTPAMAPKRDLPNRRPAIMVRRSKMRSPLPWHCGQSHDSALALNSIWQTSQTRWRRASRNSIWCLLYRSGSEGSWTHLAMANSSTLHRLELVFVKSTNSYVIIRQYVSLTTHTRSVELHSRLCLSAFDSQIFHYKL